MLKSFIHGFILLDTFTKAVIVVGSIACIVAMILVFSIMKDLERMYENEAN